MNQRRSVGPDHGLYLAESVRRDHVPNLAESDGPYVAESIDSDCGRGTTGLVGGDRGPAATGLVGPDRGSFTAELAAGLPALLLLLLAGLTAVNAVTTKAQCVDAAREAALAASRGALETPAGALPSGATVSVSVADGRVVATVRAPVRALGARLPRLTVDATAVAAVEPGASGSAS